MVAGEFSACDEELDRKVAIKLLARAPRGETIGHARILREAQAMARLSHPNVAQVYEVGRHEDRVFVAMEFIKGVTLREWLASARRPWREIVKMFIQAGRGLAAAHAAELVHRDFKPKRRRAAQATEYTRKFGTAPPRFRHGSGVPSTRPPTDPCRSG